MKRLAASTLLLLASTAWAGRLLENRQDDPEREKLERTEAGSQRGAYAGSAAGGAHRAGKPFHGTGGAGAGGGREAIPIADANYRPTTAGGSISSGGPIRTRYVSDCPNASVPCNNVTPYQSTMTRILKSFKATLTKLKNAAVELKRKVGLAGLAALGLALYLAIFRLAEIVLAFAARTDQKAQARVVAATARELQVMGEQMRTGKTLSPAEIEARSKKAGAKARREIKKNLDPKE